MSPSSGLPPWADALRNRYIQGESSQFLLYGNVRDVYPFEQDGVRSYLPLRAFLEAFFSRTREITAYYNCAEGIGFQDEMHAKRFVRASNARRLLRGEPEIAGLPTRPRDALQLLGDLVTDRSQTAAAIIDYAEMIVPTGRVVGDADRANLVTLQRWASDPSLQSSKNLVLMITEHRADLHKRIVAQPQLAQIRLLLPTQDERLAYLESLDLADLTLLLSLKDLARKTAGLNLVQIRGMLRRAAAFGWEINDRVVSSEKKAIIERECAGLVEFVDPGHDFSAVGGLERIKTDLMRMAEAIRNGPATIVPMGVLFVGPMGTGKTFVAEAFAAESGLTCMKFKNFRDKYVGETEANLEKILDIVEGLGQVLLIIDEADRAFSVGPGDAGSSSRVIARLKEFMSDTSHRGDVVVIMMTNRPDKIDTDLKRAGRLDQKIPFFYPDNDVERGAILKALIRKNKLSLGEGVTVEGIAASAGPTDNSPWGYSGAELESVLLAAARMAAHDGKAEITQALLERALTDVIPSRDTRMLRFMELQAVVEASSREMLPERYRTAETSALHAEIDELKRVLGERLR